MALCVIKGDTFAPTYRYLNCKREPIDLTGATVELTIRSAGGNLIVNLTCQILDQSIEQNKGRFIVPPLDTSGWPVGLLTIKAIRHQAGATASVLGNILVEAG